MRPDTEEALARVIREADAPLRIVGGGTRPIWPARGNDLSTGALTGVTLHDPGALTLVARAGTPVDVIQETLAAHDQRLAFEPMDHRPLLGGTGAPTIGGVMAANVSGPRRVAVGAARDFCLGVRFVDGNGTVVSNGGRVMKNVTGYDLVKLMCGSFGRLGVLTEVSLKVLPRPETTATLAIDGLSPAEAVAAMSDAFGTPFEVTGAAYVPSDKGARTCLRLEGFADSVSYRLKALSDALSRFGTHESVTDAQISKDLWSDIRDVRALASRPGDIWRISVRPSHAPDLIARLPDGAQYQLDWGGGLIWAVVPEGCDLRATLAPYVGHATCLRTGAPDIPTFEPEPAPLAALTDGLMGKFDPRAILNQRNAVSAPTRQSEGAT
ncbi:MAG: FAD-binding protein [Loktanella sp.]|nr:FAD-binding protein [Loktanella sp.]